MSKAGSATMRFNRAFPSSNAFDRYASSSCNLKVL
jgi:hypothetical protein